MPLYLHIVPEAYRERLAENLHKIIAANDYSLDFGFIGSVMVPDVLAETGYAETAYRMLTKTTLPSWGYWIKETGATSLYETWDVTRRIGDASLNHPSMGLSVPGCISIRQVYVFHRMHRLLRKY